ncbi:hypothetical protein [Pseudomonas auratipiscis]|uniref:DUF3077 domain-containing protein n=1 Tax=Pseudomonas auratipiscis TaxID=3115853 RepID=A0AB35X145_9PSED|nr:MULTISPECIES: hypothetical protein [unclassified Pseudomonas]MEE1868009.1 hypothetical protein [Pseudomonas sp. 120P]MEE1959120.1 hypothetical protein [Pseudomonas sp. 119P]
MLKVVPDPPSAINQSLEDVLIQISEYMVCALTIAQQTVLLHSSAPGQVLTLATMHEIENAQNLIEVALSKVQLKH